MTIIRLDADLITNWDSFHDLFAKLFGFPDFYGRNMNAWIDCMTSLDAPSEGMTAVHAPVGDVLVLHLENADDFARRCPNQYKDLAECAAFVNWRRIVKGDSAVLALSFNKSA